MIVENVYMLNQAIAVIILLYHIILQLKLTLRIITPLARQVEKEVITKLLFLYERGMGE